MKKRNLFGLMFACLCLLAGAGIGMGIASFRDNAPMVVYAEGDESFQEKTYTYECEQGTSTITLKSEVDFVMTMQETGGELIEATGTYIREGNTLILNLAGNEMKVTVNDETMTFGEYVEPEEEEKNKWKELYETAIQKYEEIKNKQIAGTTIGALVGAVVGAIVSFVPAMLNRSNIRKSIDDLVIARRHVERLHTELEAIKTDFKIQKAEFDVVVKSVEGLEKNLGKMEKILEKVLDDNANLHKENAELKEMILDLFSHSEVLVALGVSEEALKKYLPNK